jgi:hypothetical protein
MEFPPKDMTKNTKKGSTILKPIVPIKFDNNNGKSGTCLFAIAIIYINHKIWGYKRLSSHQDNFIPTLHPSVSKKPLNQRQFKICIVIEKKVFSYFLSRIC